jgi:hypothetical protein
MYHIKGLPKYWLKRVKTNVEAFDFQFGIWGIGSLTCFLFLCKLIRLFPLELNFYCINRMSSKNELEGQLLLPKKLLLAFLDDKAKPLIETLPLTHLFAIEFRS